VPPKPKYANCSLADQPIQIYNSADVFLGHCPQGLVGWQDHKHQLLDIDLIQHCIPQAAIPALRDPDELPLYNRSIVDGEDIWHVSEEQT